MFCNNCGNQIQDGQFFCSKCGKEIITRKELHCEKCGNPIDKDAKFCNACGTPVEPKTISKSFCQYCGKRFEENESFCSGCGHPIPDKKDNFNEFEPKAAENIEIPKTPSASKGFKELISSSATLMQVIFAVALTLILALSFSPVFKMGISSTSIFSAYDTELDISIANPAVNEGLMNRLSYIIDDDVMEVLQISFIIFCFVQLILYGTGIGVTLNSAFKNIASKRLLVFQNFLSSLSMIEIIAGFIFGLILRTAFNEQFSSRLFTFEFTFFGVVLLLLSIGTFFLSILSLREYNRRKENEQK